MTATPPSALAWLFGLQRFGMRPGLERVNALLEGMGRPDRSFRVVLVAGTNGKGATAAALDGALRAGGLRVGRFTSPHLSSAGERVVIDGVPATEAELAAQVAALRPELEAHRATFFEAATVVAVRAFARAGVEVGVFEVGLGGRFDATNALDPAVSLVTSVARDHAEVLGHDLAAIAREKAGVMRPDRPAWTAARGVALRALRAEARRIGTPLHEVGRDVAVSVRGAGWHGLTVTVRAADEDDVLRLRSPLLGRHHGANLALAASAARALGVAPDAVAQGIARTRWPGRLEPLARDGRRVLLDGAHNPAAAAALARALRELGARRPTLVVGASREKDVHAMAAALRPAVGDVVVTRARHSPRALAPAELAAAFPGARQEADPERAVEGALVATPPGGVVVVAGSLYLVGEVRAWLRGEPERLEPRWQ